MKIGIFGDSFAHPYRYKRTWPMLMHVKYTVENYALSSSSLLYSYRKFKEYSHKYDKCIFIASCYDRYFLHERFHDQMLDVLGVNQHYAHFTGAADTKRKFSNNPKIPKRQVKFYNNLVRLTNEFKYYFKHESKTRDWVVDLILKDVYESGNTLLVKAFDEGGWDYCHNDVSLNRISIREGLVANHFCYKQHQIFFDKADKWIQTGEFELTADDPMKEITKSRPWLDIHEDMLYNKV